MLWGSNVQGGCRSLCSVSRWGSWDGGDHSPLQPPAASCILLVCPGGDLVPPGDAGLSQESSCCPTDTVISFFLPSRDEVLEM